MPRTRRVEEGRIRHRTLAEYALEELLEALGLAKHVPHQGAKVLPFDVIELRDLFEVRLPIESLAVRRAAERFTEEQGEIARAQLARLDTARDAGDVREAMRAHTDFHF